MTERADDGEVDLNPVWLLTKMATRSYGALPACSVLFFSIRISLPSLTAATAASASLVPWVSRPLKKGNFYFLKEKKREDGRDRGTQGEGLCFELLLRAGSL